MKPNSLLLPPILFALYYCKKSHLDNSGTNAVKEGDEEEKDES